MEEHNDDKDIAGCLAEFSVLKQEIAQIETRKSQRLNIAYAAIAAITAIAYSKLIPEIACLAILIATSGWHEEHRLRGQLHRVGIYIKNFIEPRVRGLRWEAVLRQSNKYKQEAQREKEIFILKRPLYYLCFLLDKLFFSGEEKGQGQEDVAGECLSEDKTLGEKIKSSRCLKRARAFRSTLLSTYGVPTLASIANTVIVAYLSFQSSDVKIDLFRICGASMLFVLAMYNTLTAFSEGMRISENIQQTSDAVLKTAEEMKRNGTF